MELMDGRDDDFDHIKEAETCDCDCDCDCDVDSL